LYALPFNSQAFFNKNKKFVKITFFSSLALIAVYPPEFYYSAKITRVKLIIQIAAAYWAIISFSENWPCAQTPRRVYLYLILQMV